MEKDLSIQRYSVIPLSPNSGLIGWVPNCDTLHHLIREYRDARKVRLCPMDFFFFFSLIGVQSDSIVPHHSSTLGFFVGVVG